MPTASTRQTPDHDAPEPAIEASRLRYLDTLRTLTTHATTVHADVLAAYMVADEPTRTAALSRLHHQLRAMAAVLNEALGDRFDQARP